MGCTNLASGALLLWYTIVRNLYHRMPSFTNMVASCLPSKRLPHGGNFNDVLQGFTKCLYHFITTTINNTIIYISSIIIVVVNIAN